MNNKNKYIIIGGCIILLLVFLCFTICNNNQENNKNNDGSNNLTTPIITAKPSDVVQNIYDTNAGKIYSDEIDLKPAVDEEEVIDLSTNTEIDDSLFIKGEEVICDDEILKLLVSLFSDDLGYNVLDGANIWFEDDILCYLELEKEYYEDAICFEGNKNSSIDYLCFLKANSENKEENVKIIFEKCKEYRDVLYRCYVNDLDLIAKVSNIRIIEAEGYVFMYCLGNDSEIITSPNFDYSDVSYQYLNINANLTNNIYDTFAVYFGDAVSQ